MCIYLIYEYGANWGFPGGTSGKESAFHCRRHMRYGFSSRDRKIPWRKKMTTHSSILIWKIPWTEEPGGLQSMGSQRVGHDWVTEHTHGAILELEKILEQILNICAYTKDSKQEVPLSSANWSLPLISSCSIYSSYCSSRSTSKMYISPCQKLHFCIHLPKLHMWFFSNYLQRRDDRRRQMF